MWVIIRSILIILDIIGIYVSKWIALWLHFDGRLQNATGSILSKENLWMACVICVVFYGFNLYGSLWRYASIREMLQVIIGGLVGSNLAFLLSHWDNDYFTQSCYIIYTLVLITYVGGIRFSYRVLRKICRSSRLRLERLSRTPSSVHKKRVMLIGAGAAASLIINEYHRDLSDEKQVVLAIDDDKGKLNAKINGVPIKGTTKEIKELALAYKIEEIIITMPSASKRRIAEIIESCNDTSCEIKIFPGIKAAIDGRNKPFIRPVRIEDLLGREEIILDNHKLQDTLKNQVILVTGGGGSIGSELCRQVLSFEPKLVVIFDIYENNAYDLQNELLRRGIPSQKIRTVIGSVRDKEKLREIFSMYHPHMVFHAAAHKHVPLMEDNPSEAIKNNVFGTLNTAQVAIEFGVRKFVMISTDKAVNPTNVMGATKRICEMIIQAINETTTGTDFVAVRFGNVLGSNGSVIPLFKKQLEAGGPLTVTHPEIIRYFMTIPEAVRLVLEASTFAKGGEIFVLDMGKPVKILDLAKNFIKLSGFEVDKDIKIKFTGLRPGEKLYEELLMSEEGLQQTEFEKIFIGKPGNMAYDKLLKKLSRLKNAVDQGEDIRQALMEIVPTYHRTEYDKKIS